MIVWKCSQDHLDPTFKEDVVKLLTESPFTWNVMYGFRSTAEQNALYQKHLKGGPLAAPPGKSAHEFGLAIDVQLVENGRADWDTSHPGWKWLFAAIWAAPRLHSGRTFNDADHIERYNWKLHKNPSL